RQHADAASPSDTAAPAADPALVVATATTTATAHVPGLEPAAAPAAPAAVAAVEEEDEERRGRFWREDKIGLLLTMRSAASATDPCPHIPKTFLQPTRISKLVRELKK